MIDLAISAPSEKVVEVELDERIQTIETLLKTDDVISFVGNILFGLDNAFRDQVEGMADNEKKKNKLAAILETEGGYIEVVERIVKTLRHHYSNVEFVVPNFAMSAGAVLVMSGDAIHMDYFSTLDPIDPKIRIRAGNRFPRSDI